jgi:hypothetical protein
MFPLLLFVASGFVAKIRGNRHVFVRRPSFRDPLLELFPFEALSFRLRQQSAGIRQENSDCDYKPASAIDSMARHVLFSIPQEARLGPLSAAG